MQTSAIAQGGMNHPANSSVPALKDGQLVYAKVNKIYSNQTADITIGNMRLTAQLDAPIAVGRKYWFQVQQTGDMTALKVMQSEGSPQSIKDMASQLLQHLSLPATKENAALAQFVVRNQIPVAKEQFMVALQLTNEADRPAEAMQVLKTLHTMSLPVTESIFKAVLSIDHNQPLQQTLQSALQALETPQNDSEATLKALLSHMLESPEEKVAEQGLQKLVSTWLASKGELSDRLFRILQNIGFFPENLPQEEVVYNSLQLMGKQSAFIRNPAVQEAITLLAQMKPNQSNTQGEAIEQLKPLISRSLMESQPGSAEQKLWKAVQQEWASSDLTADRGTRVRLAGNKARSQMASAASHSDMSSKKGREAGNLLKAVYSTAKFLLQYIQSAATGIASTKQSLQLLSEGGGMDKDYLFPKQQIIQILSQSLEHEEKTVYNQWDRQLVKKVLYQEQQQLNQPAGTMLAKELKQTIKLLGLDFEHYLAHTAKGEALKEQNLFTLKPLLMKVLAETQNPAVKEHAELLVQKITAQQLLSYQTGPLLHHFVQIPLSFQGYSTELSMQWSGRQKDNGEIDASFCRVLFYLQLEHVDEIVVDMTVQNKVIKIDIKNEQAGLLKDLSTPFMERIKTNLEAVGYQLSGLSFEKPLSKAAEKPLANHLFYGKKSSYNGVDIKI
ncbi:hypothetical protein [Bacillus testis]|uniref:hypothetical protein n=1 Tax=Bacillus testis TaxID=1622072 RepID=UPI00067EB98F|nr:hypothetical protein [Bacillus testis]